MKFTKLLLACLSFTVAANAAVTLNVRNFSSATVGVPIVNAAGVPVDQGGAFASAGYFTSAPNFAEMTAVQILSIFSAVDSTPVALNSTFDGLFSAQDMSNTAYANGNFAGKSAYILVGNKSTLASSSLIAVFDTGTLLPTPDALGNASATLSATTAANWVYGTPTAVTTQPSIPGAAFTSGIQMIAAPVPETSTSLLGALGALALLRRRRN